MSGATTKTYRMPWPSMASTPVQTPSAKHRPAIAIGEGVMLAMHGHPFLPPLTRQEPQDHPEQKGHARMQGERTVRQGAVQVDRGGPDGDLGQDERGDGDDEQLTGQVVSFVEARVTAGGGCRAARACGGRGRSSCRRACA